MKVTLFFIAFLLMLSCENSKTKKDDANVEVKEEKKVDDTPRAEPDREPDTYIAFREDGDRTVYLTDSDEDIDRLIIDLKPLDVEVALLERPYWRDERCRKMSARKCAQGNCVIGDCKLVVVGGWNVCRCE